MRRNKTKAQLIVDNNQLSAELKKTNEEMDRMRTLLKNMRDDPNDNSLDVMVNARNVIMKLERMEQRVLFRSMSVESAAYLIERIIYMIKDEAENI